MYSNLIFNEDSIPFKNSTDANQYFPEFLEIIKSANSSGISTIRIHSKHHVGWFETPLTDTMNVRDWLNKQDRNVQISIKSLIDKCVYPIINQNDAENIVNFENSIFSYNGIQVPSLGCSYLLNELAISFASHPHWIKRKIILEQEIYIEGHDETKINKISTLNCATIENWRDNYSEVSNRVKEYFKKGNKLINEFETNFKNLKLCGKAKKMIQIKHFNSFYGVVNLLNDYSKSITDDKFNLSDLKEFTSLDISGESDTVKNTPKLKKSRMFTIDGEKKLFELHIKNFPENYRLHFYYFKGYIYIGYYGEHLKTKRDPK